MTKALKWVGIAAFCLVLLGLVGYLALQFYDPGLAWVKPGIAQRRIPAGVDTTVVFENVTVIPMDSDHTLEGQSVVVDAGRISEIAKSAQVRAPTGAFIIDASGKYLIPGLSDMIVHTDGSENDLLVYLANGVTTIRIMGEDPPDVLDWRDQVNAGKRLGPTMWVWWPQIESNDFDDEAAMERSTRRGKSYVHSPEEAERLVAEAAAMGVDGIKAHVVVPSEIYRAVVASAAQYGLPYDGHAPVDHNIHSSYRACDEQDCWTDFMSMGVPALTHVEELVKMAAWTDGVPHTASDETLHQMAQDAAHANMAVTTSVFLMRTILDQATDLEGMLAAMPEIEYVHPIVFDFRWAPGPNSYADLGRQSWYPNYLASIERMLLALHEAGVLLMSGTDVPVPLTVPGFSLHDELETMADIGLSPYDVLKTSTYNPALYLSELDRFGTVEVGKRADLVLLESNPLEDIANTREIAGVMVRGRYFDRADLDTILKLVARDYEKSSSQRSMLEIAFPVVGILLLAVVLWFVVRTTRRRKGKQVSG